MADHPVHIDWAGESGATYRYWIYPIDHQFGDAPANYIYAKETKPRSWRAVYIGETIDLSDRPLDSHHKKTCIESEGATHIHAHKSSTDHQERLDEEADLVAHWNPACND